MKKIKHYAPSAILGGVLGVLLGHMGFGYDTWQFYAVFLLVGLFRFEAIFNI